MTAPATPATPAAALTERAGALPRVRLGTFPTPLLVADRLGALAGGRVLVKRDDLAGFGVAGNKTRPLEFLLGAARQQRARVLVTGGGPDSNFCAAAAFGAAATGLDCELVIAGDPDSPNLALAAAVGATLRPTGDSDRDAVDRRVTERAAELTGRGVPAFAVARGGSTALGAVGFALAAAELAGQLAESGERPELIVLPLGSGGSCAGLLVGLAAVGVDIPVLAVTVSRPPVTIAARVGALAEGCAGLLGVTAPLRPPTIVDARGTGPGHGRPSAAASAGARCALRAEGLLLDDIYTARAFGVALDRLPGAGCLLFWHTGGVLPALHTLTRARKGTP